MTRTELSRRTGLTSPHVSNLERGKGTPTLETIAKIAKALGVSPATLLSTALVPPIPAIQENSPIHA